MAVRGVLREIGRAVASALAVVIDGVRLLWAHWPVLLVIFLLGAAGREAALWGAFVTSTFSPLLSALIVPLAPLATLTAFILMLRHVMPSLRHVEGGDLSMGARLQIVASALIPFLALYAAQGYLREDTRRYLNEVVSDEMNQTNVLIGETMSARTIADLSPWVVAATVVIALVLRWALDRFELPDRHVAFGLLAAWVEAIWLVFAAKNVASLVGGWDWIKSRVFVEWLLDGWADVVSALGPLGGAADRAVSWLWSILGDFDTLVVIPLAWLTVGAVVYGRQLAEPALPPGLPLEDERLRRHLEAVEQRLHRVEQVGAGVVEKAHVDRLPAWFRAWVVAPANSVRNRFAGLGRGLLTLVRAGLVPMVTLCLVFVLARQAENGLGRLLRWVLGPRDVDFMVASSTYVDIAMSAVSFVLITVLVAAAVDRFLVAPAQEAEAEIEAAAAKA